MCGPLLYNEDGNKNKSKHVTFVMTSIYIDM